MESNLALNETPVSFSDLDLDTTPAPTRFSMLVVKKPSKKAVRKEIERIKALKVPPGLIEEVAKRRLLFCKRLELIKPEGGLNDHALKILREFSKEWLAATIEDVTALEEAIDELIARPKNRIAEIVPRWWLQRNYPSMTLERRPIQVGMINGRRLASGR